MNKIAESIISDFAKLLYIEYRINNFKQCRDRYRTLKEWSKIMKLSNSSEEELQRIKETQDIIRMVSGNYASIPGKRVIEIYNNACKEEQRNIEGR